MNVLVGITGGIAAYKATGIIRLLSEAGHDVKVLPTQNALRFIGATTLEALSHNSVDSDLYADVDSVKHIELAQSADLVIVAPATAAFIARYANGLADDLLGNVLLATKARVVIAPAMHSEMWNHSSTQHNIQVLRNRGVLVLNPTSGRLTGRDSGVGRLPEPDEIVSFALASLAKQDLAGKRFLITAGGTRENIDPVRFIGNRSSGKQGIAIARAAAARGADVTLLAANIAESNIGVVNVVPVISAGDIRNYLKDNIENYDCLVMAAAISDYRVEETSPLKLKKQDLGSRFQLTLVANPDILAETVKSLAVAERRVLTVGFAAETISQETGSKTIKDFATEKLASKGCDVIVANDVANGAVFELEDNSVEIVTKTGQSFSANGTKLAVADALIDVVSDMLVEL